MKPTVLLYGFEDQEKRKRIQMALLPLRLRVRIVAPEEYGLPVGVAALGGESGIGEPTKEKQEGSDEIRELMILAGIDAKTLDLLLAALRKSGAGPIPYKAMLTETNQYWNGFELYQEICREHEQMKQMTEQQKKS